MHNNTEITHSLPILPICYQNPFLKEIAQQLAKSLWQYTIDPLLYGGAIYKIHPNDLDFFVGDCSAQEIDALFRYLKHKKDPSNAPSPSSKDLECNLVSALIDLLNKKNTRLIDAYKKTHHKHLENSSQTRQQTPSKSTDRIESGGSNYDFCGIEITSRNVLKITIDKFPVDIIFSTGSAYEHAHEVDFALGGVHFSINKNLLGFYSQQASDDYYHNVLNYLYPDKIKRDPSILMRTIRVFPTSAIPISAACQQSIHDYVSENKSIFSTVRPDRLYHDLKLSFFYGHAFLNLQNLLHFQLFDQLFGYTIPPSESALKLQRYLIEKVAIIIDENPSNYHPSLWYYALHWVQVKSMVYADPLFGRHLTSLSQPTILIPQEALFAKSTVVESKGQIKPNLVKKIEPETHKRKRNYSPDEILTAAIDQSHRELLTQLEKEYNLLINVDGAVANIPQKPSYAEIVNTRKITSKPTNANSTATDGLIEQSNEAEIDPPHAVFGPQKPSYAYIINMNKIVSESTDTNSTATDGLTEQSNEAEMDPPHAVLGPQKSSYAYITNMNKIASESTDTNSTCTDGITPQSNEKNAVMIIKVEHIDDRQTAASKNSFANSSYYFITSKTPKKWPTKSTPAPFIIEKDISYDVLCQQGQYFLTPPYENTLDAIFYFQSAQERHPDLPNAYIGLAKSAQIEAEKNKNMVELSRQQYQNMSERLKKNTSLKTQTENWRKEYTSLYNVMIGKYTQASIFYKKALEKNPFDNIILSETLANILQITQEQKDAHEKTNLIHRVTKRVKKVKNKAKSPRIPAIPKSIDKITFDANLDSVGADLQLLPSRPKTALISRKTDSDKNNSDLAEGFREQKKGNFSAAKKHYRTYLSKKEETLKVRSYKNYYSLAETLRKQIYQDKPSYQLSNPNISTEIDLLKFLIECYSKAICHLQIQKYSDAHIRITEIQFDLNEHNSGIKTLKTILESPSEKCAHHYGKKTIAARIAEAYEKNKSYQDAKEYYQRAIREAESKKIDADDMILAVASIEKRQEAIAVVARLKAEKAAQLASLSQEASQYGQEERYEEAIAKYLDMIKLDKKDLPVYRKLIALYFVTGNYTATIGWCDFLVSIDETTYNKDYLPAQKNTSISYEHHLFFSLYQRGQIYEVIAKKDSQATEKVINDYQAAKDIYMASKNISLKKDYFNIVASCYLALGENHQILAKRGRDEYAKKMHALGYQLDPTILLNDLTTQTVSPTTGSQALFMESTAFFEIISQQLSSLFLSSEAQEIIHLSQVTQQIIIEEYKAYVCLLTCMSLLPNEHQTYCILADLAISQKQIELAKQHYLTALQKIDMRAFGSPGKFDALNKLAFLVNSHACALKFIRELFGVIEKTTPAYLSLESQVSQEKDWIDFSLQFYYKAINNASISQSTQNSYMLAIISYIQEDYHTTAVILNKIILGNYFAETNSSQREILFYCGKSYQNLGINEKARQCYEGVYQQEPYDSDDPLLTENLRNLGQNALKEMSIHHESQAMTTLETEETMSLVNQSTSGTYKIRLFQEAPSNEQEQEQEQEQDDLSSEKKPDESWDLEEDMSLFSC